MKKLRELLTELSQKNWDVEVKHVKAQRTVKEKKTMTTRKILGKQ